MNNKGFTLLELVISTLIGAFLIKGASKLVVHMYEIQQEATAHQSSDAALKLLTNQIRPTVSRVFWQEFNSSSTFFKSNIRSMDFPAEINPPQDGLLGYFKFGQWLKRDSHTLVIQDSSEMLVKKIRAVWFSRCIETSKLSDTIDLQSVLKLKRRPYFFYKGDTKIIKCCEYNLNEKSFDCSKGDLSSVKSSYRTKVFFFNDPNRIAAVYPKIAEAREVFGLGFQLLFDRRVRPRSLNSLMFSLRNRCSFTDVKKTLTQKCLENGFDKTYVELENNLSFVYQNIQDTGSIDLGN